MDNLCASAKHGSIGRRSLVIGDLIAALDVALRRVTDAGAPRVLVRGRPRVDVTAPQVKNILNTRAGEDALVEWEILMTTQVEGFLDDLYNSDPASHRLVNQAILVLERNGPAEGRPLVDTVTASRIANMKELRPPSAGRSEIRILLVFDPWRSVILLVAGDKSGQWSRWYREAIPQAEQMYDDYLAEREKETGR
jgi:hypothetical protein